MKWNKTVGKLEFYFLKYFDIKGWVQQSTHGTTAYKQQEVVIPNC